MNFFEISETISLNTSLTIHPSGLAPEEPTSKNNILEPSEAQNPSLQLLQLPNVQSRCEVGSVGGKSNYSSINNILPCPDSDQSKNRTQESQSKPVEKSQLPVQASRNPELVTMRQNMSVAPRVTAADKPPMRASARPPLNPNEVAKGLSMLHSRVDELLRKKSVSRGREVSSNQSEKHQRALSTDARAETIIHHPFILTSFPKEPHTPDLLTGRTCHSIEIGFNRQHEEQNLTARLFDDQREISPQPSSLRFQTEIYQDLSLKEKSISNPVNVSSPPKPRYHLMGKVPAYTPAIRATYSIEMLKQNSALQRTLDTGLDKIEAKHKPKYDEKKLDAIVNRIRSRNSVSPTPGRGSVTETDSASVPRFSLTLNNNSVCTGRRETEPDNRNNVSGYSNWQLNTGPKERERSIEDIMSQRNFNMTTNASMLDVLGKKRSASNPKFTDVPIEGNKLTTTDKTNPVIADIIKELKNRIPTNFKETSKKESYLERTRNAVGVQSKLKAEELPFNAGIYQSSYSNKKNMENNVKRGREGLGASGNVGYQKDVVKTESDAGSNSKRGVPESMYQFNKQDLINKLAIEREKTLNLNKRLRQGFERTEKNGIEEQSPINRHGEESLTWDESAGAEMFNTTIRVNHLQDDTNNISDFDFERNRLETLGQDASREFMLNTSKLADEYGSRYGAKRQRVEEKRGSSIGLGSEKILSKTDMMRKGRFAY